MNKIELLILDIDGVLTDGKKYYGLDGMPFSKTYCDKDFTAIKRFRGSGVKVCFLSGDNVVNEQMANNRNVDFYYARGKDKAEFIKNFENIYGTTKERMCYVGDDLFDSSIMKIVSHAYCPSDACRDIKNICGKKNILKSKGGNNAIMELFDTLLDRKLITDCTMQDIEDLDKNEKF